ncbi:40S ribosomal protein S0 [Mycena kentingensis (nom. inval.)]|nr:40S ribosomal protein S0 [Mycena kentingensis (nom. inval.)]
MAIVHNLLLDVQALFYLLVGLPSIIMSLLPSPYPWNSDWFWFPDLRQTKKQPPPDFSRWRSFWLNQASPFLASHGYHLYSIADESNHCIGDLQRSRSVAAKESQHSKQVIRDDEDAVFFFHPRVWAAQDNAGRDVVIKFITGSRRGQTELRVHQLLNSAQLRQDRRNSPVPVIDLLEFGGGAFLVLPRWGPAHELDFAVVGEVVQFSKRIVELLAFFHEHGIVHGDLHEMNIVVDAVVPDTLKFKLRIAGLHGADRSYAFIDFETSSVDRAFFSAWRKRDVEMLGGVLSRPIQCICAQGADSALLDLVDAMIDVDNPHHPTATEAAARFNQICETLAEKDMNREFEWWSYGRMVPRRVPVIYSLPPKPV